MPAPANALPAQWSVPARDLDSPESDSNEKKQNSRQKKWNRVDSLWARVAELVDARDSKSLGLWPYEFESRPGYLLLHRWRPDEMGRNH